MITFDEFGLLTQATRTREWVRETVSRGVFRVGDILLVEPSGEAVVCRVLISSRGK